MNSLLIVFAIGSFNLASAQENSTDSTNSSGAPSALSIDYAVGSTGPYVVEQTSAQAIALPIIGITALILLIAPFVVQWRGKNIGQCSQILYISLANLFTVTNALIWPNFNWMAWWEGYGFCDIQAKLQQPIITGVACATVCITRRLAIAVNPDKMRVSESKRERLRIILEDCAICFLVPFLQICLHYPVQFNRYYIGAIGGCMASFDSSWPTIVFMFVWPLVFCMINCYYSVLIIYRLRQHRRQVANLLGNSRQNLSMFLRLLFNALTIVLIYTPVSIYFFYINVNIEWFPYNFASIHEEPYWSTIIYLPELGPRTADRWTNITMSFFIFLFIGTGQHAMETYRGWLLAVGFGRLFPSLMERGRQGSISTTKSSWTSNWSLISRVRSYFENVRQRTLSSLGSSQGTDNLESKDNYNISSRKGSLLPTYRHSINTTSNSSPSTLVSSSPKDDARNDSIAPLNPIIFEHTTNLNLTSAPPSNLTAGRVPLGLSHHGVTGFANISAWISRRLFNRRADKIDLGNLPAATKENDSNSGEFDVEMGERSIETKVWSESIHGRERDRGGKKKVRVGSVESVGLGMGEVNVKKSVERRESESGSERRRL